MHYFAPGNDAERRVHSFVLLRFMSNCIYCVYLKEIVREVVIALWITKIKWTI